MKQSITIGAEPPIQRSSEEESSSAGSNVDDDNGCLFPSHLGKRYDFADRRRQWKNEFLDRDRGIAEIFGVPST